MARTTGGFASGFDTGRFASGNDTSRFASRNDTSRFASGFAAFDFTTGIAATAERVQTAELRFDTTEDAETTTRTTGGFASRFAAYGLTGRFAAGRFADRFAAFDFAARIAATAERVQTTKLRFDAAENATSRRAAGITTSRFTSRFTYRFATGDFLTCRLTTAATEDFPEQASLRTRGAKSKDSQSGKYITSFHERLLVRKDHKNITQHVQTRGQI